ncbi:AAA family ATPase [Pedobacter caeni]|uniref:Adenylate kinase n=1 Tax=Pedobacter caeni TaxID=288992 RepID=A0A1M5HPR2_9SPHI|nr:AAA family ATPase [Pedobacter caeni]SHG17878.1 Adenylate kinase [Pedobacter caeni]
MKLHIFGASGSGVTTLGAALSKRLNIPYFDSDEYFWVPSDPPYTLKRDPQERNDHMRMALNRQDDWILGGSMYNWGEGVYPYFDLVVFLWIPPEIRMERIRKREMERYGEQILSDPERKMQSDAFIRWASDYDANTGIASRTLNVHEQWMKKMEYPILEIRTDLSTAARMDLILDQLSLLKMI